jgi:hypothetical protein
MTKRTAKELWDALDEATLDAEMEDALASPEDPREALAKAGYDLAQVDAEADAFFAALRPTPATAPATAPAPAPAPTGKPALAPRRLVRAVFTSVSLALAAGVGLVVWQGRPEIVGSPPPQTPQERANTLRVFAQDACEAHRWKPCLDYLDKARALDPAGDEAPAVQELRRTATKAPGP